METLWNSPGPAQGADEPSALRLGDDDDEQDGWEYEYSATETETYYLPLELSYPEFKEGAGPARRPNRRGYYKTWMDRPPENSPDAAAPPPQTANEAPEEDNEPIPDAEADNDDFTANLDPALLEAANELDGEEPQREQPQSRARNNDNGDEEPPDDGPPQEPPEDIQILELHSDNPIISYRGRVFEGQWAEVIGTELVMANHDTRNPLPALRNLNEGVDVLAATSSRILTTEKAAEPREPPEDTLAPIRQQWNIRIPAGRDKTGERKKQARFLENLMALKMKKGEEDEVTVFARDGAGKDFDDNRDPDFKPRVRRARASVRGRRGRGRPPGRPRNRNRASAGGRASPGPASGTLSTPTPETFAHLPQGDAGGKASGNSGDEDGLEESDNGSNGGDVDAEMEEDEDDDVGMED